MHLGAEKEWSHRGDVGAADGEEGGASRGTRMQSGVAQIQSRAPD